jgi:hypothetical protein
MADTPPHRRQAMSTEDKADQAPGVRTNLRTNETEDDDTEGHVKNGPRMDPDFGAQSPSVHAAAKDDDDDVEGHVKLGGH